VEIRLEVASRRQPAENAPLQLLSQLHTVAMALGLCVAVRYSVLQCVAVRCSVLQCVAVCCSVLRCVAQCGVREVQLLSQLRIVAMALGLCAAVCCSVLQCVAVCCSVV